jgi:hypothetical protein
MFGCDSEGPGSGLHWTKSSLSLSNGNCVEVARLPSDHIVIRNNKYAECPVLRSTTDEWSTFLGGVRNGEFDEFGQEVNTPDTAGE